MRCAIVGTAYLLAILVGSGCARPKRPRHKSSMADIPVQVMERYIRQSNTRTSPVDRPVVHLCGIFALRFEAPYILPWIAHHAHYGVDHFHLYKDDISSSWSDDLNEQYSQLLKLLEDSDRVTVYSMKEHSITGQEGQVQHCVINTVNIADWVGNWDFDESLSSQKYRDAGTPDILKKVLRELPHTALGVTIPRNVMFTRVKHGDDGEMPFFENKLEYEQYLVRLNTDVKGKSLWRTGAHVFPVPLAGHYLMAPEPLKHSIVAPDGSPLAAGTTERMSFRCKGCQASSEKCFRKMQEGLAAQVRVLKLAEVVESGREEMQTHGSRKRRTPFSKRVQAHSKMHADMVARWDVGSAAAANVNISITKSFSDKREGHTMDAQKVVQTGTLPSWIGVLALNHYQRSHGECRRKAEFVKQSGSIFAGSQYMIRQRSNVLKKRCQFNGLKAGGKNLERVLAHKGSEDTTLANEAPLIWAKLEEMFGKDAKPYQYELQQYYRNSVKEFLANAGSAVF